MVPFISEHVWQTLIKVAESNQTESVHLADFPKADESSIDNKLSTHVALSRRLVELGRAARAESGIRIRQPLSRALVSAPGWSEISHEIKEHISEELNILKIDGIEAAGTELVDISVKANFRSLGNKFGSDVQVIAKALADLDAQNMVKQLRLTNKFPLEVKTSNTNQVFEIELEDLVITETPRTGWSVSSRNGESLALDLELTSELIRLGLIREVIRAIQEERKNIGLDVSDRITVNWNAPKDLADVINSATNEISAEVLATKMIRIDNSQTGSAELGLWINLVKNN
jgi:isoleucyl-tRNA synthetase